MFCHVSNFAKLIRGIRIKKKKKDVFFFFKYNMLSLTAGCWTSVTGWEKQRFSIDPKSKIEISQVSCSVMSTLTQWGKHFGN